jgi:YfiH family protein
MSSIEFPLAQGWTKGLEIAFLNREDSAGYDWQSSYHTKQVHEDNYFIVPDAHPSPNELPVADGLIAKGDAIKNLGFRLAIQTADCVPLVYIDHVNHVVAIVHAGWRGLALNIHSKLFTQGHLDPTTTWIWVGPSLSGRAFEVGADVYDKFPSYKNEAMVFEEASNGKKYFHSWKFLDLEFKNLRVELVYNLEISTFDDSSFASYRRHKKFGNGDGRNVSWVGISDTL